MNKRTRFYQMHQQDELLFLPNAWDVISARILANAGFGAIGTTSFGIADSLGYPDGENIPFEQMLAVVRNIINAVEIPVTVDIESGYSQDKATVVKNVLKVAGLGAAGINIEDSSKTGKALTNISEHCALLKDIKQALETEGFNDFFVNARTDTYLQLDNPLPETIERASQYSAAGADGIFVPGMSDEDEIHQLVGLLKAPLNLMSLPKMTDSESLQEMGVKRMSIGNALSDACIAFTKQQASALYTTKNTAQLYQ